MKPNFGLWLWALGGAILSWLCVLGALAWVFLPSVTGLIFAQPITIVSVPFVDYTNASGQNVPLDPVFVLSVGAVLVSCGGAVSGVLAGAIFRVLRR